MKLHLLLTISWAILPLILCKRESSRHVYGEHEDYYDDKGPFECFSCYFGESDGDNSVLEYVLNYGIPDAMKAQGIKLPKLDTHCSSSPSEVDTKCRSACITAAAMVDFTQYDGPSLQGVLHGMNMTNVTDLGTMSLTVRGCLDTVFGNVIDEGDTKYVQAHGHDGCVHSKGYGAGLSAGLTLCACTGDKCNMHPAMHSLPPPPDTKQREGEHPFPYASCAANEGDDFFATLNKIVSNAMGEKEKGFSSPPTGDSSVCFAEDGILAFEGQQVPYVAFEGNVTGNGTEILIDTVPLTKATCDTLALYFGFSGDFTKYDGPNLGNDVTADEIRKLGKSRYILRTCFDALLGDSASQDMKDLFGADGFTSLNNPRREEAICAAVDGVGLGARLAGRACVCNWEACNGNAFDLKVVASSANVVSFASIISFAVMLMTVARVILQ